MNVLAMLKAGRVRIEDPNYWTQGAFGINAVGDPVSQDDPACVRRCLAGAIFCGDGITDHDYVEADRFLDGALASVNGDTSYMVYNDSHTHDEVLALLDKAIELAEGANANGA